MNKIFVCYCNTQMCERYHIFEGFISSPENCDFVLHFGGET
jgi:hypothetical protein